MDREPDVYNWEQLNSYNSPLFSYQNNIVDIVCIDGTDKLLELLHEVLESNADNKAVQYADFLLAEFIRHGVLDSFRELEAPMRAAYKLFTEAFQKHEDARHTTEKEIPAWQAQAEDFSLKLKELGEWAKSAARARHLRHFRRELPPFANVNVVGSSSWRRSTSDFVKYHDALFAEINFIREMSEKDVLDGRLERPVRMGNLELSLKAFEAKQAHVVALQNAEANAKAACESAELKYNEERKKAIAVMNSLSDAGQWALFRLSSLLEEPPEVCFISAN